MSKSNLIVGGLLDHPFSLTADELRARFPRAEIETRFETDNGLIAATFAGARLWDVIASAGIQAEGAQVEARAADGWSCLLALDEVDPARTDRVVLIAYERDGAPLSERDGSLRLVVPGDGPGRRFVRGLAFITVVDASAVEG